MFDLQVMSAVNRTSGAMNMGWSGNELLRRSTAHPRDVISYRFETCERGMNPCHDVGA